ncbi:MAG TPA: hypothetical protein VK348_06445 [Planctomycetota bacterium]|nr:hypothetical protein [Planctomycetota bacterium]
MLPPLAVDSPLPSPAEESVLDRCGVHIARRTVLWLPAILFAGTVRGRGQEPRAPAVAGTAVGATPPTPRLDLEQLLAGILPWRARWSPQRSPTRKSTCTGSPRW